MRGAYVYGAVLLASLALFWWAPGTDLFVSGLFYDPQHGFTLAAWRPLADLEGLVRWITWAILAVIVAGAAWLRLVGGPLWQFDRKALIFLLAALAIGPGIVVNTVLKDHWGRARPYQVSEFGGAKIFTAAPLSADQCDKNCSFVSGHAALGFSLVSFAFLLPAGRRRSIAIGAALGVGALLGLGRIAAGHHFLSDIVDAGLIVVGTTWLLHRWLVVHDGAAPITAFVRRRGETQTGRRFLWAMAIVLAEAVAILWVDRPIAEFFHADGAPVQPFFSIVQRLGLGYPWLVLSALTFALLRWGGQLDSLRRWDARMRAASYKSAFIFAAVGASGLAADVLKIVAGRARPKLLFSGGAYGFAGVDWHADHWSFPSGHAATIAALMTALWCLWPRPLWLYVAAAALIALSRVVTDQHYLGDVIAGATIAVVVTRAVAWWMLRQRDAVRPAPDAGAAPDYRAV
jgi:lipid A 4'-phosphatase